MNKYNPWEDIPVSRQFLCEESNKYNFWRYKQPTKNGHNFSFLFELKTAKDDVPPPNKLPLCNWLKVPFVIFSRLSKFDVASSAGNL